MRRPGKVEFYREKSQLGPTPGDWRWRIKAANGRIVADSGEGYKRLRDAKRGLKRAALVLSFTGWM